MARRTMLVAAVALGAAFLAGPAQADGPNWDNARLLNCEGTLYATHLPPSGFGSAFHLDGASAVITPKHVEVLLGGEWVTTFDRGSSKASVPTINCSYSDPAGLEIRFTGILTPAA